MITLECPNCSRKLGVAREATDPPGAVRAVLQCDLCDDGDRHSPEFFGADGKWIHPLAHLTDQEGQNR
jgi:hypothetical protein